MTIEHLIQIAGIGMTLVIAAAMVVPSLRLPAFMVGILSIPGNVDDLVPQMSLDFHTLPDNTGPAISIVDGLLVWALVLTLREGRRAPDSRWWRRLFVISLVLSAVATVAAIATVIGLGVEPLAAIRGILVFARIPVILFLVAALLETDPTGIRLTVAAGLGGIALLANGIYLSTSQDLERFTAATFGRNGLGMVLALVTILAAGAAVARWRGGDRIGGAALALVSIASLFGAMLTGTRMSLVALVASAVAILVFNSTWRTRHGLAQVSMVGTVGVAVIVVATLASAAGARTMSVLTDAGTIVGTVADFEGMSDDSEMRVRGDFWDQASAMARAYPLTGVGPFQWNFRRYELDPSAPVVVAGPHNAYFQIAAESGFPSLLVYFVLLGGTLLAIGSVLWRPTSSIRHDWPASAIAACACAYPLTEVTNSHLFNIRLEPFGWILLATAASMSLAAPMVRSIRSLPTR